MRLASACAHLPTTRSTVLRCLAPKGNPEGPSSREAPLTPGVLGSGPSSVVSVHRSVLRPHPPVSQARCPFTSPPRVSAPPSRCGSAEATRETFPPFPGALSVRAADPTPVGPLVAPVVHGQRYQAPSNAERVATHRPASASNPRRGSLSRRPRSRPAAARAFARPSWLATTRHLPRLLRYRVTPAFGPGRHRPVLGVRLDGRTGNLPSSGLAPD